MNTWNPRKIPMVQVVIWLLLALAMPRLVEAGSSNSQNAVGPEAKQKLAKVQIPFIPNRGQSSKEVKFTARTFAGTVSVTETGGLIYSLPKLEGDKPVQGVALKEELIGGKVKEVKGESQAVTKVSYFRGNDRTKWQSNLPSYDQVSLGEVYEGIDVKFKAYGNNVEKLFYVKPGAEPETIRMKLSGGEGVKVNASGELEVETDQGTVRFSKPIAYQEQGGKKEPVEVAYQSKGNEYGFKVGDSDPTRELVIDPVLAATFLGGSDYPDSVNAMTLDLSGNVYVAGQTCSSDFPGIGPGSADRMFAGQGENGTARGEAFIAKLNSNLSSILAATFIGGSRGDGAQAVALDSSGNVYVAGGTESSDFPSVGAGSADHTLVGGEGFVVKLNADLSSIIASSFLGGANEDVIHTLVLDITGNVYVAGVTFSPDFPGVGLHSAERTFDGIEKGFVAKLNPDLSAIIGASFLGGSGGNEDSSEQANAVLLDSAGNIYVAGGTSSLDFPGITPNSADNSFVGAHEGYVVKLNSDLSAILGATFLGGSGFDRAHFLALGSTGYIYVAGYTCSADFPGVLPSSADSTFAGFSETFVVKLNSDLSSILAATFLGGSEADYASSLAVDTEGNVYLAGLTYSVDFPGVGPGSAYSTPGQISIAKLNSDLSSILAATFLGGHGSSHITLDGVHALVLDSTGDVYVAGETYSGPFFPGVGPNSADSTFFVNVNENGSEGFVAKLDSNLSSGFPSELQIINDKVNFVVQSTSLSTTPVSGGPAGVYTITARLTNKTQQNIWEPIKAVVTTLTNGNKLLSATEGNGTAGSKQAIDAGTDNILLPNELATIRFRIGLANRNRFTFFVDIWGTVNGGQ